MVFQKEQVLNGFSVNDTINFIPLSLHFSPRSNGMDLVHPRSQRSPIFSSAAGVHLMPGAVYLYSSVSNSLTRLAISHSTPE